MVIWGLEAIAKALGVSVRKLHYLLTLPAGERPPLRRCHRGIYAVKSRLQDWVDAGDMDYGVARELDRVRATRASDPPPAAA